MILILKIAAFFAYIIVIPMLHASYDAYRRLQTPPLKVYHFQETVFFAVIVGTLAILLLQEHWKITKYMLLAFEYLPLNLIIFNPVFNYKMGNAWNWIGHPTDSSKDRSIEDEIWHWLHSNVYGKDSDTSNLPLYFGIASFIILSVFLYFKIK